MKTWGYMQCRNWNAIFNAEKIIAYSKATKLLHTASRAVDFWQQGSSLVQNVTFLVELPTHSSDCRMLLWGRRAQRAQTRQPRSACCLWLVFPFQSQNVDTLTYHRSFTGTPITSVFDQFCMGLLRLASLVVQEDQLSSLIKKTKSVSEYQYISF